MCDLIQQAESTIEQLEGIRESIVQIKATSANRAILDASYAAILEAQRQLSKLAHGESSAE